MAYPQPTYFVQANGVSGATSGDHLIQIMAGASLPVRILRIWLGVSAVTSVTALAAYDVLRLTTAGTGGSVVTPAKADNADAAAGAAGMTIPTVKGTESTVLFRRRLYPVVTQAAAGSVGVPFWEWDASIENKPIVIPAGTANGIVIKNGSSMTGLAIDITVELIESAV